MPGFFHIQFPHINRAKLRPQAEKKAVEARYDDICGALELMMKGQFDTAMSRYNG